MSRDFRYIIMDAYANKYIKSKIRATVLSVGSMFSMAIVSLTYPIAGFFADKYGIPIVLIAGGLFASACTIILFITKPKLINVST